MRSLALLAALCLSSAACSRSDSSGDANAALVARGKSVYETNCTACHARDPRVDGPVGPANACATPELVTAKVLRNEYPPGYVPKRDTRAMIPLAHLEKDLPALAAYLQSLGCEGTAASADSN
jgi:mono/diheme cytochrome c family protein